MIDVIALGITSAGAIGLAAYTTVKAIGASRQWAASEVAAASTREQLIDVRFDLEMTRGTLAESERRARALEELLNAQPHPNSDLRRDDVATRLARLGVSKEWDGPTGGDSIPADAAAELSVEPAPGSPNAVPLPAGHATVR